MLICLGFVLFKYLNQLFYNKKDKKSFKSNSKEFKDYLVTKVLKFPLICGDLKLTVFNLSSSKDYNLQSVQ